MRTIKLFLCLLITSFSVFAQQKITIEEIYTGAFRAKAMDELQALKNSNQYTVLNTDRATRSQQIELFDYANLQKVATIIDTKNFKSLADGIDSYTFSNDEKQMLIANALTPIFRHSFTADYFLFKLGFASATEDGDVSGNQTLLVIIRVF